MSPGLKRLTGYVLSALGGIAIEVELVLAALLIYAFAARGTGSLAVIGEWTGAVLSFAAGSLAIRESLRVLRGLRR